MHARSICDVTRLKYGGPIELPSCVQVPSAIIMTHASELAYCSWSKIYALCFFFLLSYCFDPSTYYVLTFALFLWFVTYISVIEHLWLVPTLP